MCIRDRRGAGPVIRVRSVLQVRARRIARKDERARSNRLGVQVSGDVAHLRPDVLRNDIAVAAVCEERGKALRERHRHFVIARRLDARQLVPQSIGVQRRSIEHVEGKDHVAGVKRLAIMPRHALAQRKDNGREVVVERPFGRQHGNVGAVDRVEVDQRIIRQPAQHR